MSVERWMAVIVALLSGLTGWVLLDRVSPVPRLVLVVTVVLYSLWIAHRELSLTETKNQAIWDESRGFNDAVSDATDADDGNDEKGQELAEADDETSEIDPAATEGKLQSELLDAVEQFRKK